MVLHLSIFRPSSQGFSTPSISVDHTITGAVAMAAFNISSSTPKSKTQVNIVTQRCSNELIPSKLGSRVTEDKK